MAAGVGFSSVPPCHLVVQLPPPLEPRVRRGPGKRGVVAVSDAEDATGTQHTERLTKRVDRPVQVLQQLVRVNHVKSRLVELQRVGVTNRECDVALAAMLTQFVSLDDDGALRVNANDAPGGNALGQVDGDGAGPAADIKQFLSGPEGVE